jgi:hypothetical protein
MNDTDLDAELADSLSVEISAGFLDGVRARVLARRRRRLTAVWLPFVAAATVAGLAVAMSTRKDSDTVRPVRLPSRVVVSASAVALPAGSASGELPIVWSRPVRLPAPSGLGPVVSGFSRTVRGPDRPMLVHRVLIDTRESAVMRAVIRRAFGGGVLVPGTDAPELLSVDDSPIDIPLIRIEPLVTSDEGARR